MDKVTFNFNPRDFSRISGQNHPVDYLAYLRAAQRRVVVPDDRLGDLDARSHSFAFGQRGNVLQYDDPFQLVRPLAW